MLCPNEDTEIRIRPIKSKVRFILSSVSDKPKNLIYNLEKCDFKQTAESKSGLNSEKESFAPLLVLSLISDG